MFSGLISSRYFGVVCVISIIAFLDQATKYIAIQYLRPVFSVSIIGEFLRLTYVENPGMAFGIPVANRLLFNGLSIAAILVILYYMFIFKNNHVLRFAFALILGGAFGNIIDRLVRGRVVDFLDVEFFDIYFSGMTFLFWEIPAFSMDRWPVFNIADMAVTCGMLTVLIMAFFEKPPQVAISEAPGENA